MALGLFLAVVLLAGVLIFVLMHGPIQTGAPAADTTKPAATTQEVQSP